MRPLSEKSERRLAEDDAIGGVHRHTLVTHSVEKIDQRRDLTGVVLPPVWNRRSQAVRQKAP